MSRYLIALLSSLFLTVGHAASLCPSVHQIKLGPLGAWRAYDANSDRPATASEQERFRHASRGFWGAEFSNDLSPSLWGRCYYTDADGYTMEVFLAANMLAPNPALPAWEHRGGELWQCRGNRPDHCPFGEAEIF